MCGRYTIAKPERIVAEFRPESVSAETGRPRYNIAPMQNAPVVAVRDGKRALLECRWGFVPQWADDPAIGNRMINARAKGVADKPSFRAAFKTSRCLVPADGFYEWRKTAQGKQPVYVQVDGGAMFAFAGLYSVWGRGEQQILTFAIVTTEPNELMSGIHNRMPVILGEEERERWLDPAGRDAADLLALLRPFDSGRMSARDVSKVVNSPSNDDPRCIEATGRP